VELAIGRPRSSLATFWYDQQENLGRQRPTRWRLLKERQILVLKPRGFWAVRAFAEPRILLCLGCERPPNSLQTSSLDLPTRVLPPLVIISRSGQSDRILVSCLCGRRQFGVRPGHFFTTFFRPFLVSTSLHELILLAYSRIRGVHLAHPVLATMSCQR
jgi:hypothetical protein